MGFFIVAGVVAVVYILLMLFLRKHISDKANIQHIFTATTTFATLITLIFTVYKGFVEMETKSIQANEPSISSTVTGDNGASAGTIEAPNGTVIFGNPDTVITGDYPVVNINPQPSQSKANEHTGTKFNFDGLQDVYTQRVEQLFRDWKPEFDYSSTPPNRETPGTGFKTDRLELAIGLVDIYWLTEDKEIGSNSVPLHGVKCIGRLYRFDTHEEVMSDESSVGEIVFDDIAPGVYYYSVEAFGYNTLFSDTVSFEGDGDSELHWHTPITQVYSSAYTEPYVIQLVDKEGNPVQNMDFYISSNFDFDLDRITYSPFRTDESGYVCRWHEVNDKEHLELALFSSLESLELRFVKDDVEPATLKPVELCSNVVMIE